MKVKKSVVSKRPGNPRVAKVENETTKSEEEGVVLEIDRDELADLIFSPEAETASEDDEDQLERPTQVRVFGKEHVINYIPRGYGMDHMGLTDYNNGIINILEDQPEAEEADTVLHEVIHVIDLTMDLDLTEHQVTALATGLFGTFQDNPEFAAWVIKQRGPNKAH